MDDRLDAAFENIALPTSKEEEAWQEKANKFDDGLDEEFANIIVEGESDHLSTAACDHGPVPQQQSGGGRVPNKSTDDASDTYEVVSDTRKYYRQFRTHGRQLTIKLRKPLPLDVMRGTMQRAFEELHKTLTMRYKECDYVGFTCRSTSFARGDAGISFRPLRDSDSNHIAGLIYSVAQSNDGFDINEELVISCAVVEGVHGNGRSKLTLDTFKKRSILTIKNDDDLCLPRALVAGMAHKLRGSARSGEKHQLWVKLRDPRGIAQKAAALHLVKNANVKIPCRWMHTQGGTVVSSLIHPRWYRNRHSHLEDFRKER